MSVKANADCVESLTELGFTELEAAAYTYLVQASPATGYRVAQALGKPVANTYKAIESLQQKGVVIADETGSKRCRAVPPDEVLDRLETRFERRHGQASRAFSRLRPAGGDDGVYALNDPDQVYDRCRAMLSRASEVALLDAFPTPLMTISEAVEACAARGVRMAVEVYEPTTALEGVETVLNPHSADTRHWPGDWLNMVVDGSELLLAFMDIDGARVHQAIWSRSPFLCWAYQSALAGEILSARVHAALGESASAAELRDIFARFSGYRAHESLGYRGLAGRFKR